MVRALYEGLYVPNCQSNLVFSLDALSLLFGVLINTTAKHWADISLHFMLAVRAL